MLFVLIATFVAGIGAAGVVYAFGRLTGRKVPRYAMPVAAGITMFAFMLWNDYGWYARATAGLPDHVRVAQHFTYKSVFQPWTLFAPRADRYVAVDMSTTWRNKNVPDIMFVDVLFVERYQTPKRVLYAFDCANSRWALVASTNPFASDGDLSSINWQPVTVQGPLIQAACRSDSKIKDRKG